MQVDSSFVFPHHRAMKNITISMPEEMVRKIRVLAAKADTSVSQYLCQLASTKVAEEDEYEAAMRRYLNPQRGGIRSQGGPLPSRESFYDRNVFRR